MNKQLIIATLAVIGLAACGEERAVQSNIPAVGAVSTPATAESAAPAGAVVAQGEKNDEPKAEAESKPESAAPQEEEKKDEGEKKAD